MSTSRLHVAVLIALLVGGVARIEAATPIERLAPPEVPPPSSASPGAALPALEVPRPGRLDPAALARQAADRAARIPAIEWDVGSRAEALGPGLEPAFTYVRDAIRYEAYAGVLRGAAGAYRARAGNAADRALLLARLLEMKKVKTRYAFGTLSAADQDRLWRRVFDTGIPLAQGLTGGGGPTDSGKAFRRRVHARASRDYSVVRAALGDRLPPVTRPTREEVLAEMNPHVWVEAEVGGQWIDLDPSFPDQKPGIPAVKAERTAAEMPADLYQRVSIRLVLEQLHDGKLEPATLLELSRNAVDLVDQQVFVVHAPGKPVPLGGLGASLGGYVTWTPAVWIGGDFNWGKTFTIEEKGGAAAPGAAGKGGLAGALDALDAEPAPGAAAVPGPPVFVAEWLEIELSGPGMPRETARRALAERGGAAWRASRPLDPTALKPLRSDAGGPVALRAQHNVWLSAGPHDLKAYADALQDLAIASMDFEAGEPPAEDDFGAAAWPTALQNFTWMVWTDNTVIPGLNDTPGARVYADRPRIAIFSSGPDVDDGFQMQIDLRRDDLRALASAPGMAGVLAGKKLWFALLQGALEHEAIAEALAALGADPRGVETTSSRLAADGVVVLAPGSSPAAAPRPPDPETGARLASALGGGALVVAPLSGLWAGGAWWEIAPGSGDARAVGDLGLHASRGGIPGNNNPLRHIKGPQQNPQGGQKVFHSPEAAKEARDAAQRARNEKKIADNVKKYNESRNNMAKAAGRRGGSEYAVLLLGILLAAAQAYVMYRMALTVMDAADVLSQ
jgi:transglutaminase superfamily protein